MIIDIVLLTLVTIILLKFLPLICANTYIFDQGNNSCLSGILPLFSKGHKKESLSQRKDLLCVFKKYTVEQNPNELSGPSNYHARVYGSIYSDHLKEDIPKHCDKTMLYQGRPEASDIEELREILAEKYPLNIPFSCKVDDMCEKFRMYQVHDFINTKKLKTLINHTIRLAILIALSYIFLFYCDHCDHDDNSNHNANIVDGHYSPSRINIRCCFILLLIFIMAMYIWEIENLLSHNISIQVFQNGRLVIYD